MSKAATSRTEAPQAEQVELSEIRIEWAAVAAGAIGLLALRTWIVALATVPRIMPDEIGTWAIARYVFSADPGINMLTQAPYPVAPALVLGPAALLPGAHLQYRAFGITSAALMLLSAWLLVRSIDRIWPTDSRKRALLIVVACAAPATFFTTAFSWSEFVIPAYWGLLVVIAVSLFDRRDYASALCGAIVVGSASLVHGRFTGVIVVWLLANCFAVGRDIRARDDAGTIRSVLPKVVGVMVTVIVVLVARRVDGFIVSNVWETPSQTFRSAWSDNLANPFFYKTLAVVAAGQLWYAVTSTFGLALLGLIGFVREARTNSAGRWPISIVLAMIATNFAISCIVVAGALTPSRMNGYRPDHLFYGRYIDGCVWVLSVAGAAVCLFEARRWRSSRLVRDGVPVGMLVFGFAFAEVHSWISDRVEFGSFFGPTAPGVWLLPFEHGDVDILRWSIVGAFVAAILLRSLTASTAKYSSLVVVGLLLGGATFATWEVRSTHRKWGYDAAYQGVPAPRDGADRIAVAADVVRRPGYSLIVFAQQYQLAADGWTIDFPDVTSDELVEEAPDGTAVIVVSIETDVSEHEIYGQIGPAQITAAQSD